MAAVVVGDSVVYYSAGGTASVFIFQRANISNPEIFRFAITMTIIATGVLLLAVVPYWGLGGPPAGTVDGPTTVGRLSPGASPATTMTNAPINVQVRTRRMRRRPCRARRRSAR